MGAEIAPVCASALTAYALRLPLPVLLDAALVSVEERAPVTRIKAPNKLHRARDQARQAADPRPIGGSNRQNRQSSFPTPWRLRLTTAAKPATTHASPRLHEHKGHARHLSGAGRMGPLRREGKRPGSAFHSRPLALGNQVERSRASKSAARNRPRTCSEQSSAVGRPKRSIKLSGAPSTCRGARGHLRRPPPGGPWR